MHLTWIQLVIDVNFQCIVVFPNNNTTNIVYIVSYKVAFVLLQIKKAEKNIIPF
jgi:hypothetical protein